MRMPQPYFKKSHQAWYVNLHGKNVRLGEDEEKAWQEYHILMAKRGKIKPGAAVQEIIGGFLAWCQENQSPGTYGYYRRFLASFGEYVGPKLKLNDLKPHHVNEWVSATYSKSGSTHKHNAVQAAKRPFAWAAEEGRIERSPLAMMRNRHTPKRRKNYIQPADFERVLAAVSHPAYRDVLVMLRRSGCRPKELRDAEARHFDRKEGVLEFAPEEAKGGEESRIIVLDMETRAIVERLALKHPEGPLFRNKWGKPWEKNAMVAWFRRLSEKHGVKVTPYTIRHVFATEALARGVPLAMVAKLMGHRNYKMLQDVYGHLELKSDELRAALEMGLKSNAS